jgi:CBS-domain-containing membrane protein
VGAPSVLVAAALLTLQPPSGSAALLVLAGAAVSFVTTLRFVVQPLQEASATTRASLLEAEQDLSVQRAELDVRSRLERALDATTNEGEALRIGLRAMA